MQTVGDRISGLYALTPETENTSELLSRVTAALRGGVRFVQYRNKNGTYALRRRQCIELLRCVRAYDSSLIVNDSAELALEIDADGVHLGKDDGSVAHARMLLGPKRIVGVSCYNDLESARAAQKASADYVAFGSFFPSPTKPTALVAPLDLLRCAGAELNVPVVAIGGINANNAASLIEAGADALALISAIFCADDIEQEVRALVNLF